jgi:hypothetical protein
MFCNPGVARLRILINLAGARTATPPVCAAKNSRYHSECFAFHSESSKEAAFLRGG